MKPTNMPSSLPFLPGNSYADPTITRYHKTQLLGLTNGVITGKSFYLPCRLANCCAQRRRLI